MVTTSARCGGMENLAQAGCKLCFHCRWATRLGPSSQPTGRPPYSLVPPFRKQTQRLWHPSGIVSGFRGASGGQQPYPTLLCGAPAAAGTEASEGPAPGHQGAARAPHSPASSGAAGVLPGRTARHPNPEPSYSPRECLRPQPTAPTRTAFRPTAATTSFAAPQNGRRPAPQVRVPEGAGWGVTSRTRRRKRADVPGLPPGNCRGLR